MPPLRIVALSLLLSPLGQAEEPSVHLGPITGIVTDGDLRRHLAEGDGVLDKPLAKVMTRIPICLREDALAADAIHIFNERNIDDLIIVNAKREPIGLVDSQDLPKLKAI